MLKAVDEFTTNKLTAYSELAPEKVEYVGADEVLVSLKTKAGEVITYSLNTAMLVHMVNLSVNLINNFKVQALGNLTAL